MNARLRSYSPDAALGFDGEADAYYERQARLLASLEHHVCMAYGTVVDPLFDALSTYLGVEMIRHQ